MLSLVLSAAVAAAAPSPMPTLPPEIIHTVTTARCNTLAKVTLPVGYVTKVNDRAFKDMAYSTRQFISRFMPGDVPTLADMQAAFGTANAAAPVNQNGSGTALSTEMSADSEDDPILYSPQQTLTAARIDQVAQRIQENINLERTYIDASLKEYPPGSDRRVDELRAHAQNVIALQQAVANKYEQFAGTYIDQMGDSWMTRQNQAALAQFKINLRSLLLGDTSGLTGGSVPQDQPNYGYESVQELARQGSTGQLVSAMRREEYEFTATEISTYNDCRGTHYVLRVQTPAPSPSPSP